MKSLTLLFMIYTNQLFFSQNDENETIQFDYSNEYQWLPKNCKNYNLETSDKQIVSQLLEKAIKDYNLKNEKKIIEIKDYKRQYIAYIDINGEKEIWINFFCDELSYNWKKKIVQVKDGGKCYFNLKINITKKTFRNLFVNGES